MCETVLKDGSILSLNKIWFEGFRLIVGLIALTLKKSLQTSAQTIVHTNYNKGFAKTKNVVCFKRQKSLNCSLNEQFSDCWIVQSAITVSIFLTYLFATFKILKTILWVIFYLSFLHSQFLRTVVFFLSIYVLTGLTLLGLILTNGIFNWCSIEWNK